MWKNNKITGIGLNNFEKMCKNEKVYNQYHKVFGCGTHPHNYYIQALTESGIIGLVIFVFLIILFLGKAQEIKGNLCFPNISMTSLEKQLFLLVFLMLLCNSFINFCNKETPKMNNTHKLFMQIKRLSKLALLKIRKGR